MQVFLPAIFFLFFISSSAQSNLLKKTVQTCSSDVLADFGDPWLSSPARRITEKSGLELYRILSPFEFNRYARTYEGLRRITRKIANFRFGASHQELLLFEDFSIEEQSLWRSLFAHSENEKKWKEVGAWIIVGSDGKRFSSNLVFGESKSIDADNLWHELQHLVSKNALEFEKVSKILFYHSHFRSPVLSRGDQSYMQWTSQQLVTAGFQGELHFYAAKRMWGGVVGSHKSTVLTRDNPFVFRVQKK